MTVALAIVGVVASMIARAAVWVSRSIDEACRFIGRMEQ